MSKDAGSFITPDMVIAMYDHNGRIHLGRETCPDMQEAGAGLSFAELVTLLAHDPDGVCQLCVRRFAGIAVSGSLIRFKLPR